MNDMNFGDWILFEDRDGLWVKGEVVDIWKNSRHEITDYIVLLNTGRTVRIKPNYPNWCKLEDGTYTQKRVAPVKY